MQTVEEVMTYACEECGTEFDKLSNLKKHRRTENHWRRFVCQSCKKTFTRKDNLDRHLKKHDNENNYQCPDCLKVFTRRETLDTHINRHHNQTGGAQKRPSINEDESPLIKKLRKDDDPRQFYSVKKIREQKIEKFRTIGSTYKVNFKNIEVTEDVLLTLKRIFKAIFEDITKGAKSNDLVRLVVECPSLDYPIVVPFGKLPTLTPERFMAEIERVLQSNEDLVIDESLTLEVTLVDMPEGGARKRCKFVNTDKFLFDKRSIIQIKNNDDLCCARAIITAKAKIDHHEKWNSIRFGCDIQRQLAMQLHSDAKIPPGKCGLDEIEQFQKILINYQINVVSKEHFNGIIYTGPDVDNKIYLFFHDGHFDVITSMAGFLSRSYYCTKCCKGYNTKEAHKCNDICYACRKIHKSSEEESISCNKCNRHFRGRECFNLHRRLTTKGNSTCSLIYRCKDCNSTVNTKLSKKQHICGNVYCDICKDFFEEGHMCYMLPAENKTVSNPMADEETDMFDVDHDKVFIFFDFECTQEDIVQCEEKYNPDVFGKCTNCLKANCGVYEHKPNLCVAQKVCTACLDKEDECKNCGPREMVFSGENTLTDFCQWLFSEENYKATVLCHNFQGYDSYPILQYLYSNAVQPKIVPSGAKIMCLTVPSCKIKMIDSINFLPMALAKLPAMFGFSELKKGYFPHLYNRKRNQNVILQGLPDVSYYNPDGMKPPEKQDFMQWYNAHKYDRFDFQQELRNYCKSDVDILKRCCLKFRENFINITGVDPFERCITIASACNLVFRTNFLQAETIALIPPHGYKPEQKQSIKALQWIKYIAHSEGRTIQHARNGGEKAIGPFRVDGYYESQEGEKVVLEFHGDYWHGNPTKYARTTINSVNQMSMGELYDKTVEKQNFLENEGYTYRSIWETDFDQSLKENSKMKFFVDKLDIVTPLEPRDAFYGGRTEAYTMFKEATVEEQVKYYDVTSLYPYINKTGKIPIGHPAIITEDFSVLEDYEGLVKCKVLPPRDLFHPVLPCRNNKKLLFHLCKTCAETKNQDKCNHTNEERSFVGTWVTDEVKIAVKKGYKVVKIYEVWHFDKLSQYDPITKTGGLFTEYVNTFLKIKQEASGFPAWCQTEDDKNKYINMYHQKEGILLEYKNIKKNLGIRALAKLMLNSFWGKFGQRANLEQVDFVTEPNIYFDKLTSDQEVVTAVNYVSNDMIEMRWKYAESFANSNTNTNVVIAAYTTAQARLKLFSYLDNLGQRALYADTDSVIFTAKDGEWKPVLGDYLGDMTDEVPGNEVNVFMTGGAKNYAFKLQNPDDNGNYTHCKIRGITLNCKNLLNVNFDVLMNFVTKSPLGKVSVVDANKISRARDNAQIVTILEKKDYRIVFDKRVIRENYISYPYGF